MVKGKEVVSDLRPGLGGESNGPLSCSGLASCALPGYLSLPGATTRLPALRPWRRSFPGAVCSLSAAREGSCCRVQAQSQVQSQVQSQLQRCSAADQPTQPPGGGQAESVAGSSTVAAPRRKERRQGTAPRTLRPCLEPGTVTCARQTPRLRLGTNSSKVSFRWVCRDQS